MLKFTFQQYVSKFLAAMPDLNFAKGVKVWVGFSQRS